jgi:hypothetical protein
MFQQYRCLRFPFMHPRHEKSLIHLQTYEGWSTSPPTYENGFFTP